jgi:plasmid maintenance system antidote protein VapI
MTAHTIKLNKTDTHDDFADYAHMLGLPVKRLQDETERPQVPPDMAYALAKIYGADPKEWLS